MTIRRNWRVICLILLCLLSSTILLKGIAAPNSVEKDTMVVVFDEAHSQFFNRSLYQSALADLEAKNIEIVYNHQKINRTTLEAVDLFISTNPIEAFAFEEIHYLVNFLLDDNALFLLANPLDETNSSLTGNGQYFNTFLRSPEMALNIGFWTRPDDLGNVKRTDVVINDFYNAGKRDYLLLDINSSAHEILEYNGNNISSVVTSSCSIQASPESIVIASSQAHAETVLNEINTYPEDITLFGLEREIELGEAKVLLGGSSIMFSDLYDQTLNSTWYESVDNALLWQNIVGWLLESGVEESGGEIQISTQALIYLIGIGIVAIGLILGGNVLFLVGSGRKATVIKTDEIRVIPVRSKEKLVEEKPVTPEPTKGSRRERRMKQLQKRQPSQKKRSRK